MTSFTKNKFTVYCGKVNGVIVYIGTTIQKPIRRFQWHKSNGKDYAFEVLFQYDNAEDMLKKEFELVKLHSKTLKNKIKHRIQNLNVKLTQEELDKRKGDKQWCQSCLKRRTTYSKCYACEKKFVKR